MSGSGGRKCIVHADILRLPYDPRTIAGIRMPSGFDIEVGQVGVSAICAYEEYGEMAMVPWFAVYSGDQIIARCNGKHVECVKYKLENHAC